MKEVEKMTNFQAGFARIDITPPLGIYMAGYFSARNAEAVLDPLLASALAVSDGQNTALLFSVDVIGIRQNVLDGMREQIAAACGLERAQVFIACTHTHTGPEMSLGRLFPSDPAYNERFTQLLAQAGISAITDLKPASLLAARGQAPGISFVRRFRMKDGSFRTNPGYNNPDVLAAVSSPDEEVQLVRIQRAGGGEILLVNFQVHPDVVSGSKLSADFIKFTRDSLENALPGSHCIYFNGAQGDVNHIDIHAAKDKPSRYELSRHMGQVIAGSVLQIHATARPLASGSVLASEISLAAPLNKASAEELEKARQINELFKSGRSEEIPGEGMSVTAKIAEATRMLRLADGPDQHELNITAVRFGDVCFAGLPGEPFNDIGRGIKAASLAAMQFICCCANGYEGYYPMQDSFTEGGYEAKSSSFKAGIAESLIETSLANIKSLF